MLKLCTRFPRTWRILSNTSLDMGFPEVLGLEVILYSISIRIFLNSLPINSFPWSYVISVGIGYLDSHLVSTKFVIDIALYFHIALFQTVMVQGWSSQRLLGVSFLSIALSVWCKVLLYLHRVYSMVFPQITKLVIYHIFYLIVLYVDKYHS